MSQRKFPLIMRNDKGQSIKAFIAWEVAELFREQAYKNHGQSLERLAERGGLSPFEAACALAGSSLFTGIKPNREQALLMLAGAAHALDRLAERTRKGKVS